MALDHTSLLTQEGVHQCEQLAGIELFRDGRAAAHVRKQHRHLAALAVHRHLAATLSNFRDDLRRYIFATALGNAARSPRLAEVDRKRGGWGKSVAVRL